MTERLKDIGGGRSGGKRKMTKKLLLFPLYLLKWIFILGTIALLISLFGVSITFILAWILSLIGAGVLNFLLKAISIGIVAALITVCAVEDWRNKHN
jgi:hypothetical protein